MHVAFAFLHIGVLEMHSQQVISGQEDLVTLGMAWPRCSSKDYTRFGHLSPGRIREADFLEGEGVEVGLLGLTLHSHHRQAV